MNIEVRQPELVALINQRMATGRFENVEELLRHSLENSPESEPVLLKQNFTDFMKQSPLWGSGLTIERQKDFPRPVDL